MLLLTIVTVALAYGLFMAIVSLAKIALFVAMFKLIKTVLNIAYNIIRFVYVSVYIILLSSLCIVGLVAVICLALGV